jgi:hypothetical protein
MSLIARESKQLRRPWIEDERETCQCSGSRREAIQCRRTSDDLAPSEFSRRSMGTSSFFLASIESFEGCSAAGTAEDGESTWNGFSSEGDSAGVATGFGVSRATFLTALFQSRCACESDVVASAKLPCEASVRGISSVTCRAQSDSSPVAGTNLEQKDGSCCLVGHRRSLSLGRLFPEARTADELRVILDVLGRGQRSLVGSDAAQGDKTLVSKRSTAKI